VIHIRIDGHTDNTKRKFACGIGPDLPAGDTYFFAGEGMAREADCQGCNPGGPHRLGTPLSQISGHPGYEEFVRIAKSWGYD